MLQEQQPCTETGGRATIQRRPQPVFALVDCVSCFVSCEQVFRPDLIGRPVIVMSPNDSFVVAASEEAKALQIVVGDPVQPLQSRIDDGEIVALSANFPLYEDLSRRVMATLQSFAAQMEVYSIDEAWLDMTMVAPTDRHSYGCQIRQRVRQGTGIPVRVGIAPTKTLSKLANRLAQRWPDPSTADGVLDLCDPDRRHAALLDFPIEGVWGIGVAFHKRLAKHGITTAAHLVDAPDWWIRRCLGVDGWRTASELRGISCLPLESTPAPRQSCRLSSAFGHPVTQLADLQGAVTHYINTACARLRRDGVVASTLSVTIWTEYDRVAHRRYHKTETVMATIPTQEPLLWAQLARKALAAIYLPGYRYVRAGIAFEGLMKAEAIPLSLFPCLDAQRTDAKINRLSNTMAKINQRFGTRTIYLGAEGLTQPWQARRARLSPPYTTDIRHLATART